MRFTRTSRVLLAAVPLLLSCGDSTAPRTPTSVTVVAGSGQSAAVATLLAQPIVVEVKDVDGKPVRGVDVAWNVTNGGGSVSQAMTRTNGMGRAQVSWTLGSTSGQNRINASVTGVAPAVAVATAQAGPPTTMAIVFGGNQTGIASLTLAGALRVRVNDQYGNSVAGVAVTFTPSEGTATPQTVVSNTNGVAQTTWVLGSTAGQQTLDASIAGTSVSARFTATALAPNQITELQNDVAVGGIGSSQGVNRYYRISLPNDVTRLTVTLQGADGVGDVDLFVEPGALPSTASFECQSTTPTANELCVVQTPAPGDWYILLDAYSAYSGVTLRGTYIVGGAIAVSVTGLPQAVAAGLTIAGPGSYSQTVPGSQLVTGLIPGSYTVSAANVLAAGVVYNGTPASQQVDVVAGGMANATVTYAESSGGLNLDITGAYITQSVQRPNGSVPLVAGRDGLVRVLARANALNTEAPEVRVRVYHAGALVDTRTVAAPAAAVPVVSDEGQLTSTWNVVLPGSLIQPGMSLLVDIDPADAVAEADEADNGYPASGTPLALDVRTAAVMRARLVPVLQIDNNLQGDVTTANMQSYITMAQAIYPFPAMDVDVRAPYNFNGVLPSQYDSIWSRLLNEIYMLRTVTEMSDRYYFGVIKPAYTQGGTGLGYIGFPAALGVEWQNWRAETVAHEWGHNFGRRHVACGGPTGTDPDYPHTERPGALGFHGWDVRTNTLVSADQHQDVMSYCQPYWASDYTYEAVLDFRAAEAAAGGAAEPSLLVWGRISPEGVVLEPAFEVVTRPTVPQRRGKYRLTGTDATGAAVLDISFDGYEVDHMPGVHHFSYAIPLRALRGGAPHELRLRGDGVDEVRREAQPGAAASADVRVTRAGAGAIRLQWDAARSPVLMVRDPRTGEVLTFARGGDARIRTDAAEVEVHMSNGVRSTARRVVVAQ